jgi:hypothetical protein
LLFGQVPRLREGKPAAKPITLLFGQVPRLREGKPAAKPITLLFGQVLPRSRLPKHLDQISDRCESLRGVT